MSFTPEQLESLERIIGEMGPGDKPRKRQIRSETLWGGGFLGALTTAIVTAGVHFSGKIEEHGTKVDKLELAVSSRLDKLESKVEEQGKIGAALAALEERVRKEEQAGAMLRAQIDAKK